MQKKKFQVIFHVTTLVFYHLRISNVKKFLSKSVFSEIIHLVIIIKLDYYVSLFAGVTKCAVHRLQLIHNAAAQIVTLLAHVNTFKNLTSCMNSFKWLFLTVYM